MSALAELQVAIVARLKADSGVAALVSSRVYDSMAPDGTTLPYVTVGEFTGVEQGSALGNIAYGHTGGVHAFASDMEGNKGALAVAGAVKTALRAPLTLSGFSATRLKLDFETVLPEPGKRHVPMRFRTTALETA